MARGPLTGPDRYYALDRFVLRLTFAGPPVLLRLADALLSAEEVARPDLSVTVLADETAGDPQGNVRGRRDGVLLLRDETSQTVLDGDAAEHRVALGRGPGWPARAAPLSQMLGAWLARREVDLVHAGAVGTQEGCVLLVGPSGAGKSHVALSCLAEGMGYLGDDTILLSGAAEPVARAVFRTAQPGTETARAIPGLAELVEPGPGKPMALLDPARILREAPLRAIAVVGRSPRPETSARPIGAREALLGFLPASLMALTADEPGGLLRRVGRIAAGLPCFALSAGTDRAELAAQVRALA